MDAKLIRSACEGFVGSFKLAAMLVFALVTVVSGFAHGEAGSWQDVVRRLHR